jgi:hypothetical protein
MVPKKYIVKYRPKIFKNNDIIVKGGLLGENKQEGKKEEMGGRK